MMKRKEPSAAVISTNDPLFHLHELAESIGPMSNRQMDETIYGG